MSDSSVGGAEVVARLPYPSSFGVSLLARFHSRGDVLVDVVYDCPTGDCVEGGRKFTVEFSGVRSCTLERGVGAHPDPDMTYIKELVEVNTTPLLGLPYDVLTVQLPASADVSGDHAACIRLFRLVTDAPHYVEVLAKRAIVTTVDQCFYGAGWIAESQPPADI